MRVSLFVISVPCNQMLGKDEDFLRLGNTVAPGEDLEVICAHFAEQELIDFSHDASGAERLQIANGE